ncbi:hypothetical protein [Pseudotenacibaculum haliotis]|uniref:DUF4169 family protein n=1 Tax=Pseudotenacibaculum haliotis TaxID=1862138 RepID=A0ABW5LP57_9FLAO
MGTKNDVLTNAPAKLLELAEKGLHRLFFKASKVKRTVKRLDKRKENKEQKKFREQELLSKVERDEADAFFASALNRNKAQQRLSELKQNNTDQAKEPDR